MKLNVVEVFDSIQGEGEWMGTMCTFIRLPGCNYSCPFCDTDFSKANFWLDTEKQPMQYHVVITGGEPSIHPKIVRLIHELRIDNNHYVHVESNGTNVLKLIEADWLTISPKRDEWRKTIKKPNWPKWRYDELKLIVDEQFDEMNWMWACRAWLQPCDGPYLEQSKKRIIELVKQYPDHFRAGIQLHKYYEVV